MVGDPTLYTAGSWSVALERSNVGRKEWRARGSAAAGPESNAALTKEYEGLPSLTPGKGHCGFGGKK